MQIVLYVEVPGNNNLNLYCFNKKTCQFDMKRQHACDKARFTFKYGPE
jgi:hypothetical protein